MKHDLNDIIDQLRNGERYKCLAVSTVHITEQDAAALNALAKGVHCNMILERDTGFFVKLYTDAVSYVEDNYYSELSKNANNILVNAVKAGFSMVEFDCDAMVYDCLEQFDW